MSAETVEIDGRGRVLSDELLDRLVGKWKISGNIVGRKLEQQADIKWVLNHQFLQIQFLDISPINPQDHTPKYDALVYVGYDNMSERYVIFWLDTFGGRFAETIGFGTKQSIDSIKFVFQYPDGPLHDTFSYDRENGTWSIKIVQKDAKGKWTDFATELLEKVR
jgi:hypothetical protein